MIRLKSLHKWIPSINCQFRPFFLRLIIFIILLSFMFQFNKYYSTTFRSLASVDSSKLFKYYLRLQNESLFHFVKFRNLDTLIPLCERIATIECLKYLHQNQSEYFEILSAEELKTFRNDYCFTTEKLLFHTFLDDIDRLNDPLLQLHIQSYLYTQNRQCSNMIIWILSTFDNDDQIDEKYKIYEPYVQIRTLSPFIDDLHQVDIHIDSHWTRLPRRWFLPSLAIVSDAVRFFVLNKFGGIYSDIDVLLLRDFQPLFAHEFAYRWSATDDFNTAILRLFPQSNTSSMVIDNARKTKSTYAFHPLALTSYSLSTNFKRLPCVLFDPLWLAADGTDQIAMNAWQLTNDTIQTFENVFKRENEISRQGRNVFDGAFAFHWHALNRLGVFQDGSYLHQWNQFFNRELYDDFNENIKR